MNSDNAGGSIVAQPAAGARPPAVALRRIHKWFGPVHANDDVSLAIGGGSIHGIVGENGAGKSTLMSILYGYYEADSGEIEVAGRPVVIRRPHDAIVAGIGMVHQHFMLVGSFSVLENVMLGVEDGPVLSRGRARARAELARLEREYHLEVDPDARVGDLPVGRQQRVEILKALYRGAQVLILDEPTGVLTPQEADHLFRILRALRDEGKTVILITHKLREILDVTDHVTVMRAGRIVASLPTSTTSKEQLAELMVGRKVLLQVDKAPAHPGETVLEIEDLRVTDEAGVPRVKGVSFALRAGEIVGIAGVSGNGQSELLEAIAGIRVAAGGRLRWKGRDITDDRRLRSGGGMRYAGLGHVPEDRQRMGLVTAFAADESAILGYHDDRAYNGPVLTDRGKVVASCDRLMTDFDVRPHNPYLATSSFSGGNQQKIVVAREMDRHPDLLLVGQPTRGVDIGAIEFIHKRIVALRDAGKAVLLVSVELDEILSLADRILVMFDGQIVGEVPRERADERTLGLMMAGIQAEAA
jgi:simple sugar transport system ATP-binding protein